MEYVELNKKNFIIKRHFKTIKSLVIKEKTIAVYSDTYITFDEKWKLFTGIYDYRGPDNPLIYS